jgi:hypothetical protein
MKKEMLEIDFNFKTGKNPKIGKTINCFGILLIYIIKKLKILIHFFKKSNYKFWFCACKIRERHPSFDDMGFFFRKNLERKYTLSKFFYLYDKVDFFTKNERLFDVLSIFLKLLKFRVSWKSEIFFSNKLLNNFSLQILQSREKKKYSKIKLKIKERCELTSLFLAQHNITDVLVSKIWFIDMEKRIMPLPWWRKLNTRESELEYLELTRVFTESVNIDKFKN